MTERKAVYYGQVELIPGIVCDGYVLDDDTAVMSERGTADLLKMDQKTLNAVRGNWPIKTLKPFIDEGSTVRGNLVEVVARNSPHCHREIVVYTTQTIKSLIHTYASAFINDGLRKNQVHIGKRAVALSISLVQTALEVAIKQACGLSPNIQQTAQNNYIDAVKLISRKKFLRSKNFFLEKSLVLHALLPMTLLSKRTLSDSLMCRKAPSIAFLENTKATLSRLNWMLQPFVLSVIKHHV